MELITTPSLIGLEDVGWKEERCVGGGEDDLTMVEVSVDVTSSRKMRSSGSVSGTVELTKLHVRETFALLMRRCFGG